MGGRKSFSLAPDDLIGISLFPGKLQKRHVRPSLASRRSCWPCGPLVMATLDIGVFPAQEGTMEQ